MDITQPKSNEEIKKMLNEINIPKITLLTGDYARKAVYIRNHIGSAYTTLYADEVQYFPSEDKDNVLPSSGSYNLFSGYTNTNCYLFSSGDAAYDQEFVDALKGYQTDPRINLPRATGGGSAPDIQDRAEVIILSETDDWIKELDISIPDLDRELIYSVIIF